MKNIKQELHDRTVRFWNDMNLQNSFSGMIVTLGTRYYIHTWNVVHDALVPMNQTIRKNIKNGLK